MYRCIYGYDAVNSIKRRARLRCTGTHGSHKGEQPHTGVEFIDFSMHVMCCGDFESCSRSYLNVCVMRGSLVIYIPHNNIVGLASTRNKHVNITEITIS